jgi:hypothetical protein
MDCVEMKVNPSFPLPLIPLPHVAAAEAPKNAKQLCFALWKLCGI